jgi:hypothetical protein
VDRDSADKTYPVSITYAGAAVSNPDSTAPLLPTGELMSSKKEELFIERREQGDYAVRRGGSGRASAVEPTQSEAIDRAAEMDPNAAIFVERVRNTNRGSRDKWRKP